MTKDETDRLDDERRESLMKADSPKAIALAAFRLAAFRFASNRGNMSDMATALTLVSETGGLINLGAKTQ